MGNRKQRLVVWGALLFLLALGGCSSLANLNRADAGEVPPDYVNIERTGSLLIQLVPTGLGAKPVNDHPAAFEAEQLQALLLSLRIRSQDEGVVTLSSPERLRAVSAGLSEALARAQPNQDVFVAFFRSKSGPLFLSSQRLVTSARVFFEDDKLNLVFDELDNVYSSFRDPQTNPLEPGSRTDATDVDGQRLVERGSWTWRGDRRDWVQLKATKAAIAAARANMPATTSLGADRGAQSLQYGPAASEGDGPDRQTAPAPMSEDTATMPAAPPASSPARVADEMPAAAPVPAAAEEAAESMDSGNDAWQRLETRLQSLKKLRDQGLISDQDYEDKKDELLEDLP